MEIVSQATACRASLRYLPTKNFCHQIKHVCTSPGHVFVFSQIAFWRAKQKIANRLCKCFGVGMTSHSSISIPLRWGSTALVQQHKLTSRQFAPSGGKSPFLLLHTKPAESTDKVLSKSEEIKWGQKWTFFSPPTKQAKKHRKANANLVKLQRYSMHTHRLRFPLFI